MIKVIHCKKRDFKSEAYYNYIGRPSPLGNPFVWDKSTPKGSTIPKYKEWLIGKIKDRDKEVLDELNRLLEIALIRDLELGCWCSPSVCHGDVIKELLDDKIMKYKMKNN